MLCPSCGAQNALDSRHCGSCGAALTTGSAPSSDAGRSAAAGPSDLTASAAGGAARLARLGDRLFAVVLDSLLLIAVWVAIDMEIALRWGGVSARGYSLKGEPAFLSLALDLMLALLYFWILEARWGATLGKALAGIRVRRADGGKCNSIAALSRNLLRIVDGIAFYLVGFLIAVFSARRQRLGDHLAKTVVVESAPGRGALVAATALWLAVVGGGFWGAYLLHARAPALAARAPEAMAGSSSRSAAVLTLAATAPVLSGAEMKVANFAFLESQHGPPRPAGAYRPGDKVYASYEFAGLITDARGVVHSVDSVVPLDPAGLPLYAPYKDVTDRPPDDGGTVKNSFSFAIPSFAPAGTYKIQIKLHDAIRNADAELVPSFTVDAPPLPVSDRLELHDLRLSLSEDGPAAAPAILPSGGTLYISGKIAGMQFRDNRADVHFSLEVVGPDGKLFFATPDLIALDGPQPYHPPTFFLPVHARLDVPAGADKGAYTGKYAVTDRVADTSTSAELEFQVR
jgi:uncharacterized RDD family membrane protein YckC